MILYIATIFIPLSPDTGFLLPLDGGSLPEPLRPPCSLRSPWFGKKSLSSCLVTNSCTSKMGIKSWGSFWPLHSESCPLYRRCDRFIRKLKNVQFRRGEIKYGGKWKLTANMITETYKKQLSCIQFIIIELTLEYSSPVMAPEYWTFRCLPFRSDYFCIDWCVFGMNQLKALQLLWRLYFYTKKATSTCSISRVLVCCILEYHWLFVFKTIIWKIIKTLQFGSHVRREVDLSFYYCSEASLQK